VLRKLPLRKRVKIGSTKAAKSRKYKGFLVLGIKSRLLIF